MRILTVLLNALVYSLFLTSLVTAAERPQKVKTQAPQANQVAAVTQSVSSPPTILSIIPAQAEPGAKVTIYGSEFGTSSALFLGSQQVALVVANDKHLEFIVPQLDAGLYALYVKRGDGMVGRVYNFAVQDLRPVLHTLQPDKINSCTLGAEREVSARGQNFREQSQLLFDGAVIPSRFVSPDEIVFLAPQATGGLHQIMIKNSQENGTLPRILTFETRPDISQVTVGSEYVNYYELNIYGSNFQQNSSIYVDGYRIGGKGEISGERDRLVFLDCSRLVYQRHPYTQVNKEFRILVINPNGEASQTVSVTAP